jgi:hypothetical protein
VNGISHKQGTQGVQIMYSPKGMVKEASNVENQYIPNNTETRALLDVE